jgi:hypothetical protein
VVTVRQLSPGDLARVEPLLVEYPYKPYRYYRALSRKAQHAVMRAEIEDTIARADGIVLERDGGTAIGVARSLPWDSAFFGVPMGRIEYVLAVDRSRLSPLIDDLVTALSARGVRHVSARVDVADIPAMSAFESAGFRLMDALVTYITRPGKEPPHAVREVGRIREFHQEDGAEVLAITEEAYRGFRGRFHLDPHLDAGRCDAFYTEWARQTVSGTMADMLFVSEGADGRLLGYLAFRRREPVSSAGGVTVYGGGLGACRADAPGAYAGLIRAGTVWAHEHGGVAECQTQNYNFPTIRIYEAVGAHYVRAEYTLHCWLGEPAPAAL